MVSWLTDEHGWNRSKAALFLGAIIFLLGIPASWGYSILGDVRFLGLELLDGYDWVANSILLPLGGLLTAVFAGYVWGAKKTAEEANRGAGRFTIGRWYPFVIRYLIPVTIAIIIIIGLYDTFTG